MDATDPGIVFDGNGYCNHCIKAIKDLVKHIFIDENVKNQKLNEIINEIQLAGRDKKYDCVIGLSGGVYSSYLAYLIVEKFNLHPLPIHVDNGWNSEIATQNIKKHCKEIRH